MTDGEREIQDELERDARELAGPIDPEEYEAWLDSLDMPPYEIGGES